MDLTMVGLLGASAALAAAFIWTKGAVPQVAVLLGMAVFSASMLGIIIRATEVWHGKRGGGAPKGEDANRAGR